MEYNKIGIEELYLYIHTVFVWPSLRFRVLCHRVSNHQWFANAVLLCILVSSAMLAAENPLVARSKLNDVRFLYSIFWTNRMLPRFISYSIYYCISLYLFVLVLTVLYSHCTV